MPKPGEGVLGGHAVLAVGYDDESQCFMIRNSWGKSWVGKAISQCPIPICLRTIFQTIFGLFVSFINLRSDAVNGMPNIG